MFFHIHYDGSVVRAMAHSLWSSHKGSFSCSRGVSIWFIASIFAFLVYTFLELTGKVNSASKASISLLWCLINGYNFFGSRQWQHPGLKALTPFKTLKLSVNLLLFSYSVINNILILKSWSFRRYLLSAVFNLVTSVEFWERFSFL